MSDYDVRDYGMCDACEAENVLISYDGMTCRWECDLCAKEDREPPMTDSQIADLCAALSEIEQEDAA